MATEAELDALIEQVMDKVTAVGDDTRALSQEESAEFYGAIASECRDREQLIREEMRNNGD